MQKISRMLSLALLLTLVLALALASGAAAKGKTGGKIEKGTVGGSPFTGKWSTTEADGSVVKLEIRGWNNNHEIKLSDSYYAACNGGATGKGSGKITNGVLNTNLTIRCNGTGTVAASSVNLGLVKSAKNKLADAQGLAYTMQGGRCGR